MCARDDLKSTLIDLELLGPAGRFDFLKAVAESTGGYLKAPEQGNNWDTGMFEVKALNLSAEGSDVPELVRNWIKIAKNSLPPMRPISTSQTDHFRAFP